MPGSRLDLNDQYLRLIVCKLALEVLKISERFWVLMQKFSRVDVTQFDDDDDDDIEPASMPHGGTEMSSMADMMKGMMPPGAMENMMGMESMMGAGSLEGRDWDEYKATAMNESDVGKTVDASAGKGELMKTLVKAASIGDVDNPRDGSELVLTYKGVIHNSRVVFDEEHAYSPWTVSFGSNELPAHVARMVKTMRKGEKANFVMESTHVFSEALLPKDVVRGEKIEYVVHLHESREVDVLAGGALVVKTLKKGQGWERPQEHYEVSCRWRGEVADTGFVFVDESEYIYTFGDSTLPRFWSELKLRKGDEVEVMVEPEAAFGSQGNSPIGVPPGARLKLRIKMLDWLAVEDISKSQDGSALKRVLAKGVGWERARVQYDCDVSISVQYSDMQLNQHFGPGQTSNALVIGSIGENAEICRLRGACGNFDVDGVLELLLPTMAEGEEAEVQCGAVSVKALLRGWCKVEPVPHTDGLVIKRTIYEPKDVYDRPNEFSRCTIDFSVKMADNASTAPVQEVNGLSFQQGLRQVLPCIDAAVREMKQGERAEIRAPAEWAFGAATEELPQSCISIASAMGQKSSNSVIIELYLCCYEREKELWEMNAHEKMDIQLRLKEQGNRLFKRGDFEKAVRRYEKANTAAPTIIDFEKSAKGDGGSDPINVTDSDVESSQAVKISCLVNLANCHLKLGAASAAVTACTKAIESKSSNAKALWIRGRARLALSDYDESRSDLMAAARLDPRSREIRATLDELKKRIAESRKNEKATFGGMFS